MRRSLLLLSITFSITLNAQSWCPPGATWQFNLLFVFGYIEYSYAGDTLLNGMEAQVISHASVLQYPQPPPQPPSEPQYTFDPVALITRNEGDMVYLWSTQSETWDTLFLWNAQIGDRWTMAHGGDGCEPFEVLDIGTIEVDGVQLKWLDLNNVSGRIIERIGSPWEFMPFCPPGHVDGMGGLRCYRDDEIGYQEAGWNYGCTSLVSVDEISSDRITLFPNPGTDRFNLQLPHGEHQLKIFDQLGRLVIEIDSISDQAVIGTASLRAGIYTVLTTDRNGRSFHQRWIKE